MENVSSLMSDIVYVEESITIRVGNKSICISIVIL